MKKSIGQPESPYTLDIYGYVSLENILEPNEVGRIMAALHHMNAHADLESKRIYAHRRGEQHVELAYLIEYDPALLEYAGQPKLVPVVEEFVGGNIRLEETEAIINRKDPDVVFLSK